MAENTRLSDLTRMLLSSPAFSTFLSDLSGNGVAPPSFSSSSGQKSQSTTVKAPPTPVTRKDVNPHQVVKLQDQSRQDVAQVGMALVPETTLDYGPLESASNAWTEGAMDFGLYDAQVFTVTELPQGPAVDQVGSGILSGKSTYSPTSYVTCDEPKNELPVVELMPTMKNDGPIEESEWRRDDIEFDESDPAFALFDNCPSRVALISPGVEPALFGRTEPDKAFSRLELVVEEQVDGTGEISTATMETFERLCSGLEAASNRIATLIPCQRM